MQTQSQALQAVQEQQAIMLTHLLPLLPIVQAVPLHIDSLKSHFKETLECALALIKANQMIPPPSPEVPILATGDLLEVSEKSTGVKRKRPLVPEGSERTLVHGHDNDSSQEGRKRPKFQGPTRSINFSSSGQDSIMGDSPSIGLANITTQRGGSSTPSSPNSEVHTTRPARQGCMVDLTNQGSQPTFLHPLNIEETLIPSNRREPHKSLHAVSGGLTTEREHTKPRLAPREFSLSSIPQPMLSRACSITPAGRKPSLSRVESAILNTIEKKKQTSPPTTRGSMTHRAVGFVRYPSMTPPSKVPPSSTLLAVPRTWTPSGVPKTPTIPSRFAPQETPIVSGLETRRPPTSISRVLQRSLTLNFRDPMRMTSGPAQFSPAENTNSLNSSGSSVATPLGFGMNNRRRDLRRTSPVCFLLSLREVYTNAGSFDRNREDVLSF